MTDTRPGYREHNEENSEETLAERSARLEAEAMGLYSSRDNDAAASPQSSPSEDILALKAELDKAKDQMLRAMAEAENARKRALKEREDATKYAISSFSRDLITVSDNLRRALGAVPADALEVEPRLKGLVEGIEATERELYKAFEQHGIRRIDPIDEMFNPNFHEVMFESPGSGKKPGTVTQVIEVGYILHDRLLRPARVGVAKDECSAQPGSRIDTQA